MSRVRALWLGILLLAAVAGPGAAAGPSASSDALPTQVAQTTTSAIIIAPSAPPLLRAGAAPPLPAGESTVVWQQGHWAWAGTTWVWRAGQYAQPPAPKAVWNPNHRVLQVDGS